MSVVHDSAAPVAHSVTALDTLDGVPVPTRTQSLARTTQDLLSLPGYRYVDGAGTPVTGALKGVEGIQKDPRDLEEARRLLTEAGYPDGSR